MYCLDSDISINFLRGKSPELLQLFRTIDPRMVKVPAVAVAELLTDAEKSVSRKKTLAATESFLLAFEVLPFDMECARAHSQIRAKLEQQGRTIGRNDLLIAATALAHHATLLTNNVQEFKQVPGLQVETWDVMEF